MNVLQEQIYCLIVDDEEHLANSIQNELMRLSEEKPIVNIEYICGYSASKALKIMKEKEISVFILDYNLEGGENASKIIDYIKNPEKKLIYMVSGEVGNDIREYMGEAYEGIEYKTKPISSIEINSIHNQIIKYQRDNLEHRIKAYYTNKEAIFIEIKDTLEEDIKMHLKDFSNLIKIESRIKEYNSFSKKLKQNNYNIDSINDFFGLRIVCYYLSDIDKIIEILKEEFDINILKDKKEEFFGYRSIHLIVNINSKYEKIHRYQSIKNIIFEIQIRTVVMHAWASVSHHLFYKKDNNSKELNRKLRRLSAILEEADESFDKMLLTENRGN